MKYKIFASKEDRKKALIALAAILFLISIILYFSAHFQTFFKDINKIKEFVLSYGPWAPIVLILLQILQVVIAPIPGQIAGFASGYIFGAIKGTIYTMIGTVIGSLIVVVLARNLGRPFVEKVIDKNTLKRFDYLSEEKGTYVLFLIYLLPLFPDDAVSFIAGLTKISIKRLLLITFLGRLPGLLILNMLGSGVANSKAAFSVILFSILMIISFFVYMYKKELEKLFMKTIKR